MARMNVTCDSYIPCRMSHISGYATPHWTSVRGAHPATTPLSLASAKRTRRLETWPVRRVASDMRQIFVSDLSDLPTVAGGNTYVVGRRILMDRTFAQGEPPWPLVDQLRRLDRRLPVLHFGGRENTGPGVNAECIVEDESCSLSSNNLLQRGRTKLSSRCSET